MLSLAQAIERLETRTTELAARLETDDDAVAADDADTRTDEAIAALMGSIERINTIAAAISQAGTPRSSAAVAASAPSTDSAHNLGAYLPYFCVRGGGTTRNAPCPIRKHGDASGRQSPEGLVEGDTLQQGT